MHFKNEQDVKSGPHHHTATTSTSSSTSSTDSGVIIIDNRTTIDRRHNSNNNNKSNHHSNGNIKNTNVYNSNKSEMAKDKIEVPTKVDNSIRHNEQLNNHNHNGYNNNNANNNNNIKINQSDECNSGPTTISIENVINIEKGQVNGESSDVNDATTAAQAAATTPTPTSARTQRMSNNNQEKYQYSTNIGNSSKCCSPSVSIRSTSISIVSIDENAIDSSVVDSDSDHEADTEGVHTNYVVKKLGQQTTYQPGSIDMPTINKGLTVLSQKISPNGGALTANVLNGGFHPSSVPVKFSGGPVTPTTPQIGSIALTNSTDVTFGDKHFYEGPVTIQQILIDRRDKFKADEEHGHDNPGFAKESDYDVTGAKKNSPPHHPESPYSFICRRKVLLIIAVIVAIMIAVSVIVMTTTSSSQSKPRIGDGDDSRKNIPINSTIGADNIGGGLILRIIARDGWLAQPPSKPPIPLRLPIRKVVVIPTQTDICTSQAMCTYRVRYIQTFNIESLQNDDIIYNFLIGGDGNVYEGRGWDYLGAHLKGYNNETISLAYIGTFRQQPPDDKQLGVTKLLLQEGVRLGKLSQDFKIYAATTFDPTSLNTISAKALYESFKDWPHWSTK